MQRPLVWLGCADPAKSIESSGCDDPEQNTLHAVLDAWHAATAEKAVTVKELRATQSDDLREALRDAAPGKDGEIDLRRLGHYLSRMKGRIAGRLKLTQAGTDTHRQKPMWQVIARGA